MCRSILSIPTGLQGISRNNRAIPTFLCSKLHTDLVVSKSPNGKAKLRENGRFMEIRSMPSIPTGFQDISRNNRAIPISLRSKFHTSLVVHNISKWHDLLANIHKSFIMQTRGTRRDHDRQHIRCPQNYSASVVQQTITLINIFRKNYRESSKRLRGGRRKLRSPARLHRT